MNTIIRKICLILLLSSGIGLYTENGTFSCVNMTMASFEMDPRESGQPENPISYEIEDEHDPYEPDPLEPGPIPTVDAPDSELPEDPQIEDPNAKDPNDEEYDGEGNGEGGDDDDDDDKDKDPCETGDADPCECGDADPCECGDADPCECGEGDPCECGDADPCLCGDVNPCECEDADPCECGGDCEGDEPPCETGDCGGPPQIIPKAQKIFRNPNMTVANWEKLNKVLDKMMKDCLGEALYNALLGKLNGKTLFFNYTPSGYTGPNASGYFEVDGGRITIEEMDDKTLFHEMFHAFQAYGETLETWNDSSLNQEIEAWFAQYRYISQSSGYGESGDRWEKFYNKDEIGITVSGLNSFFDVNGDLVSGVTIGKVNNYLSQETLPAFRNHPGYANKAFDDTRSFSNNLKDFQELSKNCE